MRTRIPLYCLCLIWQSIVISVPAQNKPGNRAPAVGKALPDYTFTDVEHYYRKHFSSKPKGKWLMLDFWTSYCGTCIERFPEIDSLQRALGQKIQILLVAANDSRYNRNIKSIFNKLSRKMDLQLPVAYDSLIFSRWHISSVPFIIIIDPGGIVRAITGGRDLTTSKLNALMTGKEVSFYSTDNVVEYDSKKLLLVGGNGGEDTAFLYRSVLAKYNLEGQSSLKRLSDDPEILRHSRFQVTMVPLFWLYNYAYFGQNSWTLFDDSFYGKVSVYPVLKIRDSSLFEFDFGRKSLTGLYDYSICVPGKLASISYLMKSMQNELNNYFGYEATVENRDMPCWNLVLFDSIKRHIVTKGGEVVHSSYTPTGISVRNVSMKEVLKEIVTYHQTEPPFFNATGIDSNIDLDIDALLTDIADLRKGLQHVGLDLVKSSTPMKVLVIQDPKQF